MTQLVAAAKVPAAEVPRLCWCFFFLVSAMAHETRLREGVGGSHRLSRSGSNCLLGNLRHPKTHSCGGRNCYRSFPTGKACRPPKRAPGRRRAMQHGPSWCGFLKKHKETATHQVKPPCVHADKFERYSVVRYNFFIAQGQYLLLWVSRFWIGTCFQCGG